MELPVRPSGDETTFSAQRARGAKGLNDAEAVDEDVGNQVHDPHAEEEEEGAATKPLPQPKKPSAREISAHEVLHVPYRNWCVHCVKGRSG